MNSAGFVGAILTLSNAADLGTAPGNDIGYDWVFNNDIDGDGIPNNADNCYKLSNATQVDSDGDGFGNRCDGDMNQNGITNSQDYVLFRQQIGQPSIAPTYNKADINANGVVNSQDYVLFRGLIGAPPGPGVLP